ncbi:MAG TPA: SDR family oxidoreductase [Candidatus Koribacter sp.]
MTKIALITGASSGIGLELARKFAQEKYDLVLVARNRARLMEIGAEFQKTYGVEVRISPKDLSHSKAPRELFDELTEAGVKVHTLVNNAGFGGYGEFATSDLQHELEMLQLNIVSLTELTKLFLPQIISAKGAVMNVASTAAFQPGPLMSVYYASKAYVLSFTEAIAEELAPRGVKVSALCPGPVPSGFQDRANLHGSPMLKSPAVLGAAEVARIGYEGLQKGKPVVIAGKLNQVGVQMLRLSPRKVVTKMVKRIQEKKQ